MDQNGVTGTRFTLPETATIIQKNNTGKKETGFQNTGHQAMKKREIGNKKVCSTTAQLTTLTVFKLQFKEWKLK